jgi:hypothetical protein
MGAHADQDHICVEFTDYNFADGMSSGKDAQVSDNRNASHFASLLWFDAARAMVVSAQEIRP